MALAVGEEEGVSLPVAADVDQLSRHRRRATGTLDHPEPHTGVEAGDGLSS
jgi:hypothetical protein